MKLPEWTEQTLDIYSRIIDPLGLSTPSHRLITRIMLGVTAQNFKVVYYLLFSWLIHKYADKTDLKERILRAGTALVLGWKWNNFSTSNILGHTYAPAQHPKLSSSLNLVKQKEVRRNVQYALTYYIIGVNLLLPRSISGKLIKCFERVIDLKSFSRIFANNCRVKDTIQAVKYIPEKLQKSSTVRNLFTEQLFAKFKDPSSSDIKRRNSFLLFLHMAEKAGKNGLSDKDYREICFSGKSSRLGHYWPPVDFFEHFNYWTVFMLHDCLSTCLRAILCIVNRIVKGSISGQSWTELLRSLTVDLDTEIIRKKTQLKNIPSFDSPLKTWQNRFYIPEEININPKKGKIPLLCNVIYNYFPFEYYLSEEIRNSVEENGISSRQVLPLAALCFVLLDQRYKCKTIKENIAFEEYCSDVLDSNSVGLPTFSHSFERWKDLSMRDLLKATIDEMVIQRHLLLAGKKLADFNKKTYYFISDGDRLTPILRRSQVRTARETDKFNNIGSLLVDIGFCRHSDGKYYIINERKKILSEFMRNPK